MEKGYNEYNKEKEVLLVRQDELWNQIAELERELALLPEGSITKKKIKGREYYYHRVTQEGKRKEKYISFELVPELKKKIEKRKVFEKELRLLKAQVILEDIAESKNEEQLQFKTIVRSGRQLKAQIDITRKYKKRECIKQLREYIFGEQQDRVFILYGLRRTGKTTMIRQILTELPEEEFKKAAFIQVKIGDTLADIDADLRILEEKDFKYIFIDEVTLMEDFIEGAALFSDIYASSGMKIVLSGTDSLGFLFAQDEQLYDRCIMLHTTFIPYNEFENVLGIIGIDNYIRYGGTMSPGGVRYNDDSTIFATTKSTDMYIDSAIAHNIQHSLKNYQYETHFRSLQDLYEKNELTNAINRIVEDMNHRFTIEVLTRDFNSNDLGISAKNLRKDREHPNNILDQIDVMQVNNTLKELLEIRNKEEQTVEIQDAHRFEIKEYLELLGLIVEIEIRWMTDYNRKETRIVFSQPGMRYSQAEALIKSLMEDEKFRNLSLVERKYVTERILDEVKGRMMEDIVLLETKLARKNCEVFPLQFAIGEFDMVVFNPDEGNCEIYEIKHSEETVPQQCTHLLDEKKCKETEWRYGPIKGKYVIYRGKTAELKKVVEDAEKNVRYLNVEEYLKGLRERV